MATIATKPTVTTIIMTVIIAAMGVLTATVARTATAQAITIIMGTLAIRALVIMVLRTTDITNTTMATAGMVMTTATAATNTIRLNHWRSRPGALAGSLRPQFFGFRGQKNVRIPATRLSVSGSSPAART